MVNIIFECEGKNCNQKEINPDVMNGCPKCKSTVFKATYK